MTSKIYNPMTIKKSIQNDGEAVQTSVELANEISGTNVSTWDNMCEDLVANKKDRPRLRVYTEDKLIQLTAEIKTPTEDEVKDKLGRKWKNLLVQMWLLAGHVAEKSKSGKGFQEVAVNKKSKTIQKLLDCGERSITKYIAYATKLGLLIPTRTEYCAGKYSRAYLLNDRVYKVLADIYNTYILSHMGSDSDSATDEGSDSTSGGAIQNSQLGERFVETDFRGSDSRELDVAYGKVGQLVATDEEVIAGLHKHYPFLGYYENKIQEMNKRLPAKCQIRMTPKITRSNPERDYHIKVAKAIRNGAPIPKQPKQFVPKVTKVGTRATSDVCNTPHDTRHEDLKALLGWEEVHGYDVKSSIYRVQYALNHDGEWLPESIDFYATMIPEGITMQRETYKALSQRLGFSSSPKESFAKFKSDRVKEGVKTETVEAHRESWYRMWHYMREVLGGDTYQDIFLHESCLYLDLMEALMNKGIRVAQVYDCLYADRPIADLCRELLPDLAKAYVARVRDTKVLCSALLTTTLSHMGSDSRESSSETINSDIRRSDSHNDETVSDIRGSDSDDFMKNDTIERQTDEDFLDALTQPDVVIIPTTIKRTTIADIEAQQDADLEEVFALGEDDGEQDTAAAPTMDSILDEFFSEDKPQKVAYEVRPLDVLLDELEAASSGSGNCTDKCDNTWQHARYIDEAHRREEAINRGKREYMTW